MDNKEKEINEVKDQMRELADRPEALEQQPEAGDVWLENDGTCHFVSGMDEHLTSSMLNEHGDSYTRHFETDPLGGDIDDFTYLGKFDEVYVKISDVREALEVSVGLGYSVLSLIKPETSTQAWIVPHGKEKIRKALRKLNIITD